MLRKSLSFVLCVAVIGLSTTACSKKQALTANKKPAGPSKKIEIDATVVRTLVTNELKLSDSFFSALRDQKNLYTPDNCFQFVKHTKNGVEIGKYLELSNTTCPAGQPLDEANVLLRLEVKQHPQYFTQFRINYVGGPSPEVGMIRKLTIEGQEQFVLEALCDVETIWYDESFDQYCTIEVESSLLRSPFPLEMFNMD